MICTNCQVEDGVEFTQEDWEALDISVVVAVCESWKCLKCLNRKDEEL